MHRPILSLKSIGCIVILLLLGSGLLPAQENQLSYMSQKLMLENNLRERITDALDKLLDDIKFVVDVKVELEFQTVEQVQVTEEEVPETAAPITPSERAPVEEQLPEETRGQPEEDLALPLPGFETPQSVVRGQARETPALPEGPPKEEVAEKVTPKRQLQPQEPTSTRVRKSTMSIPVVKRQQVNIIMEDGVTPEIVENVRQVVSVASHYDRARGDIISIMTASFKKREEQDDAEAIILKNIAEKIDNLERRQRQAEQEARIEKQRRLERQTMIRDSLRIQELKRQITDLQGQIQAPQISEDQRQEKIKMADAREQELQNLKEQLRESNRRLQEMELGSLEGSPPGLSSIQNLGVLIALAAIGLILIVLLVALLISRRNQQRRQEMEWGYGTKVPMGPRPKAKAPSETAAKPEAAAPSTPPQAPQAAPQAPETPQAPQPSPKPPEDYEAQKEEMKSIKQSVISMSVGQPDTASRVIHDWLGQEPQTEEGESELEGGE